MFTSFTELSNILLLFIAIGTMLYCLKINLDSKHLSNLKRIYGALILVLGIISFTFFTLGIHSLSATNSLSFLTLIFSLYLLTWGFESLTQKFTFTWLTFFFYLGVALTFIVARILLFSPFTDVGDILVLPVFEGIGLLFVWSIAHVVRIIQRYQPNNQEQVSLSKYQHYRQQGLSDQEIDFLREQMAPAKVHIEAIEQAFQENAKLRSIELKYNTIKVCQQQFKDIVNDPTRLAEASDFLYKYLPSLEDILQKYNEINGHITKNKQSYLIMERSCEIIEQLCQKINDHYLQFHSDTFAQMEDDLSLAERQLNNNSIHDRLDDLLDL